MATVYVESWDDFLDAVQVAGDDVFCPENAIWDMNEIAPEGISTLPTVACTHIYGRGTEIRNLRTSVYFVIYAPNVESVDSLHFVNFVADMGVYFISGSGHVKFSNSKFSGICGTQARGVIDCDHTTYNNASTERCSFVVDSQYGGQFRVASIGIKYCRLHIAVPNGTFRMPATSAFFSYFRIDQPTATALDARNAVGCVFDGDMQAVTAASTPQSPAYISIFNATSIPGIAPTDYFKGVTEAQLRDPEYLAGIGFPIGYEPEEA